MVPNITPAVGLTSKIPPNGGEFVVMMTLLDEEKPFSRKHLRVKIKVDCGERLFPTITKLITWGEFIDEGRVRERGEMDMDDNITESSFTDHCKSPLNSMSTLPKIFNFDEGFINNDPDGTSNLTTGDRESMIEIWMTFSQLLSPSDLPLKTIVNTSPTTAKDEFVVTTISEESGEDDENTRDGQKSRNAGDIWKQLNSKNKFWDELGSKLES
jgi:hypothetical protein